MKFGLLILFTFWGTLIALGNFEHEYVVPKTLYTNDMVELRLRSTRTRDLKLVSRPGLVNGIWLQNTSQRSSSSNNKNSFEVSFFIRATHVGVLQIPELKVQSGSQTFAIAPFKQEIKDSNTRKIDAGAQGDIALKDLAFGSMTLNGQNTSASDVRKTFYINEPMLLDFLLYWDKSKDVRIGRYPDFQLDHAVFDNSGNPESRIFTPPVVAGQAEYLNRSFQVIRFSTTFYILKPGEFTISAENQMSFVQSANKRGGFLNLFNDVRSYPFLVKYPGFSFKVLPLPPEPPGVIFSGVVAPVDITYELPIQAKLGESISLKVILHSKFTTIKPKAPQLDIPNFRNYGGELKESSNATIFEYPLIPIKSGVLPVKIALAVFDPLVGEYQTYVLDQNINITPDNLGRTELVATALTPQPGNIDKSPQYKSESIRPDYQKTSMSSSVLLPLWRNVQIILWVLLISGPVGYLIVLFYRHRHNRLNSSPKLQRMRLAQQQQSNIIKQLQDSEDMSSLLTIANGSLSTYLSNKLDLAPGSSPAEIAEHLSSPENAQTMRFAGTEAFKPDHDESQLDSTKSQLLKLAKTLLIVLTLITPVTLSSDDAFNSANTNFAQGDFAKAITEYKHLLSSSAPSPNLLYNLANAENAIGNKAQALGYLESAYLLDPTDDAISHNLNLLRQKFQLTATPQLKRPSDIFQTWKSSLRPDQWILLAACAWFGLFVALAIRQLTHAWKVGICIGMTVIIIGSSSITLYQCQYEYAPSRSILIASTQMRTLPNSQGDEIATLRPATPAQLLQVVGNYALIKCGDTQGWVPRKDLYVVLAKGLF